MQKYRGGEQDIKHAMEVERQKRSEREGRKKADTINRKYRAAEQDIQYKRQRKPKKKRESIHVHDDDEENVVSMK